ncbi:GtrA family protein [Luteococcus peritonei]|uniref:GtrA family protein n=1 Tax=Luteococcus peritonei TaxID=88874 RepID=A0ABW4RVD7_9ACTN
MSDPALPPGKAGSSVSGAAHGRLTRWRLAFDRIRDRLWSWLGPLRRWIPATAVGYVMINGFTFSTDVALLTLFHRGLHLPYPVSVTLGYVIALALAYLLNRTLNFESHARVGGELARYVVVTVLNYTAFVLALSWVLVHLGVQFQVARVSAATAEAVFMYLSMRFVVFRRGDEPRA